MANGNWLNELRVTAQGIIDRLEAILESTDRLYTRDNFTYVRRVLVVPATDTAIADTLFPPPGVIWKIRRVAITGGINGGFAMYLDEAQPQNLVDGDFSNSAMGAWSPGGDGVYVPSGSALILRFFSQPASQTCTVNLRVTELKVDE